MRNDYNGCFSAVCVFAHRSENKPLTFRVKSGCRFVKHKHLRLHCHYTGNSGTPLLPSRQVKRGFFSFGFRDPDKCGIFSNPTLYLIIWKPHILWSESNIRRHCFFKQLIFRVLHHKPNAEAYLAYLLGIFPYILSVKQHIAAFRFFKTVEQPYER